MSRNSQQTPSPFLRWVVLLLPVCHETCDLLHERHVNGSSTSHNKRHPDLVQSAYNWHTTHTTRAPKNCFLVGSGGEWCAGSSQSYSQSRLKFDALYHNTQSREKHSKQASRKQQQQLTTRYAFVDSAGNTEISAGGLPQSTADPTSTPTQVDEKLRLEIPICTDSEVTTQPSTADAVPTPQTRIPWKFKWS